MRNPFTATSPGKRDMPNPSFEAFMSTIVPLERETPYAKVLIYGDSGVGKTVLATTMGERCLLVDAVDGWVSLLNHPDLMAKVSRVQYFGLSQLDTLADIILDGGMSDYDTIIIDEASAIATFDLDTVLSARSRKDINKDPNVPTQPDFFANTERCRRTFQKLIKLPINVVLVAHVREDKDERTGVVTKRPQFTPKLRTTLQQSMHLVGYLTASETKKGEETEYLRRLQTMPSRGIEAKSRIGGLPFIVDNPNLGELLHNFIEEEVKAEMPKEPDAPVQESDNDFPFGEE